MESFTTTNVPDHRPCYKKGCRFPATFRMTWPGDDERDVCAVHATQARAASRAMGFRLQLKPLSWEDDDGD